MSSADPLRRLEAFHDWKRRWYIEGHVIGSIDLNMPVNNEQMLQITEANRRCSYRTLMNMIEKDHDEFITEAVRDGEHEPPTYRPQRREYLASIAMLRATPKEK